MKLDGTKRPVVIFDLDRTITSFGTYTPFLVYYLVRHNPLRLVFTPVIIVYAILYLLKFRTRKQLKTTMFGLLIGRPRQTAIASASAAYVDKTLRKNVYREAMEAIELWRSRQAVLVLATASYDWLADIFGRRLGFDHVVATRSLQSAGHIIAGIDGENCYGPEKLARVNRTIGPLGVLVASGHELWFYTDHHSDICLLAECTHPVGVNPTRKLANWLKTRANATTVRWDKKA